MSEAMNSFTPAGVIGKAFVGQSRVYQDYAAVYPGQVEVVKGRAVPKDRPHFNRWKKRKAQLGVIYDN
jgi:hypothetical protein